MDANAQGTTAKSATPSGDLEQQILDYNVPKNEREWWAHHEILRLRARVGEPQGSAIEFDNGWRDELYQSRTAERKHACGCHGWQDVTACCSLCTS